MVQRYLERGGAAWLPRRTRYRRPVWAFEFFDLILSPAFAGGNGDFEVGMIGFTIGDLRLTVRLDWSEGERLW